MPKSPWPGSGDPPKGARSWRRWMRSTVWSAFANVPAPMVWVQSADDDRSTRNSFQVFGGGMNPTLYCQKFPGSGKAGPRPIEKWISSASGAPTSSSHSRTWVMPAATQSPAYSGPIERVPKLPAVAFETWRYPSLFPWDETQGPGRYTVESPGAGIGDHRASAPGGEGDPGPILDEPQRRRRAGHGGEGRKCERHQEYQAKASASRAAFPSRDAKHLGLSSVQGSCKRPAHKE